MPLDLDANSDLTVVLDDLGTSVSIEDGSDPPNAVQVTVLAGELSFRERPEKVFVVNRGRLKEVLEGPEEPVRARFDLCFRGLVSDGQAPTPFEALRRSGAAAGWVSTRPAGEAYAVDVVFRLPDASGGPGEVVTLRDFAPEEIRFEAGSEVDRLQVSGRAFSVLAEKETA